MTTFTTADIPDFTGRTVIVTGANGGIGRSVARDLAAMAAHRARSVPMTSNIVR
jgi:NAD(P)-dependent dehydrogenase (short-subunit alcohol dehydrogenase family)